MANTIDISAILDSHGKWLRSDVGGSRATLSGADLRGADLRGADLRRADLGWATLSGANLNRADLGRATLRGATLSGADLRGADLREANLRRADLNRANLSGADLRGATLDTGETWEQYLVEIVPALLTAGGKTVESIVESGAWDCDNWTNCPMAAAFDVHEFSHIPILLQPRAEQFIRLYDAKLIPNPLDG